MRSDTPAVATPRTVPGSVVAGWKSEDLLRELHERALVPTDSVAVCSVGSAARGWSNLGSDLDFNIVTKGSREHSRSHSFPVPLAPDHVPVHTFYGKGRVWEAKYWTEAQVAQMLSKISWDRFEEGGTTPDKLLSEAEELFIERCVTGVPLEGQSWVSERRKEIEGSAFQAIVVTRSLTRSDAYIEDALGQLAAHDFASSVLSARSAFGYAVDALLESHGSYGSSIPKWRPRRFVEADAKVLSYEEYWVMETMQSYDSSEPGKWIRGVISVCRRISSAIEI